MPKSATVLENQLGVQLKNLVCLIEVLREIIKKLRFITYRPVLLQDLNEANPDRTEFCG
jgi:hypothetical protein